MYQAGDVVIYGSEGACRVESVGVPKAQMADSGRQYYTLAPLYRNGRIFTPVDGTVFMRPIISRERAQEIVRKIPTISPEVIESASLRLLTEKYQETLRTHDCESIAKLIKDLWFKRKRAYAKGKRFGQVDERFMRRAEDMLYGELAAALDIPVEEVPERITQAAKEYEDSQKADPRTGDE